VQLLETLAGSGGPRAQALAAQVKLAEMHLSRKKSDAAEELVSRILKEDSRNINALSCVRPFAWIAVSSMQP